MQNILSNPTLYVEPLSAGGFIWFVRRQHSPTNISSGTGWKLTGLGIALASGDPNPALSGYFWNYPSKGMCPISGGYWLNGSNAGVWAFGLGDVRGGSSSGVGFRSALYL
jgi:hypothetical protein